MINDLATVKQHLRVSSSAEDALIQLYMDAAEDWIANYLDSMPVANPSVQAAHLLVVADLYEIREAQVIQSSINKNPAVERLLFPYRQNLGV